MQSMFEMLVCFVADFYDICAQILSFYEDGVGENPFSIG